MPTAPGYEINVRDASVPRTANTDTGQAFIVGQTTSGPTDKAVLVRSLRDYVDTFGDRGTTTAKIAYDAVETLFKTGVSKVFVAKDVPVGSGTPSISATTLGTALALFTDDLGPGQVLAPEHVAADDHAALLGHAAANNRFALLDGASAASAAQLATLAATDRALGSDAEGLARFGALFAPYAVIPGVLAGTTRTVPYSAVQAGLIAAVDAQGNPNVPAAGDNGIAPFVLGLSKTFTEAERGTLNDAGVNVARVINGQVKTYGYRTLVDPDVSQWKMASNARLAMAITARAGVVAEHYVLRQIDGRGVLLSQFNADLSAMLSEFYALGALFGNTPDEAFRVETGVAINTPTTLAAGEVHASMGVRMSPFAERIYVDIVKTPVDSTV